MSNRSDTTHWRIGWRGHDLDAARSWALEMPSSVARDRALSALVLDAARGGTVERRLIDALSSPDVRQNVVSAAIPVLAYRDPTEAQTLLDTYVTDPVLRRQAEQQVGAQPAPPPTVPRSR